MASIIIGVTVMEFLSSMKLETFCEKFFPISESAVDGNA
jgi:hypothetical protein